MQTKVLTPIVRAVVILIFLSILSAIIQRLSMFQGLYIQEMGISVLVLAKSIFSFITAVILWNFVREFSPVLRELMPNYKEGDTLLKYLVLLITIVIIYGALLQLLENLIYEYLWLYQISFILLAMYPIIMGGLLLYTSVDKIIGTVDSQTKRIEEIQCSKCGTSNPQNSTYCQKCGNELSPKNKEPLNKQCPKCNFQNSPNADFCSKCGTKV